MNSEEMKATEFKSEISGILRRWEAGEITLSEYGEALVNAAASEAERARKEYEKRCPWILTETFGNNIVVHYCANLGEYHDAYETWFDNSVVHAQFTLSGGARVSLGVDVTDSSIVRSMTVEQKCAFAVFGIACDCDQCEYAGYGEVDQI